MGFASIMFLLMILPLLTLIIIFALINYQSASRDLFRKNCITEGLLLQKEVSEQIENLFKLNPESTLLRNKIKILKSELAVASAAGQAATVAQLMALLNFYIQKQLLLDAEQKQILIQAEARLYISENRFQKKIDQQLQDWNLIWTGLLKTYKKIKIIKKIDLGVQSDLVGGVAPNYELSLNYTYERSMDLIWQNEFYLWIKEPLELNSHTKSKISCVLSAEKVNQKWVYKGKMVSH